MSERPEPSAARSIEYVSVTEREAPKLLLRAARILAIAPMIVGALVLLLFWLTDAGLLIGVGLFTLMFGGAAAFLGLGFSILYLHQARRATIHRTAALRNGITSLLLALLNVPVAAVCVFVGGYLAAATAVATFVIKNDSGTAINGGKLFHGNCQAAIGSIMPKSSGKVRMRISDYGPLNIEIYRADRVLRASVTGEMDADDFRGVDGMEIHVTADQITGGG